MIDKNKRYLLIASFTSILALVVAYLLSIPATSTDFFGHTHTPSGFTWAIYLFGALAVATGGAWGLLTASEHIK